MANKIINNIKKVIFGKDDIIEKLVIALLAGGHVLLEDIPGIGKTMLAKALSLSINGDSSRIQFTSDLLPSDIIGSAIFNPVTGNFEIKKGPIFSNIILADEINRSTPRTQSALLECMEEFQVTIEGTTFKLESPFMVIATSNPGDYEGCYPLVESQMDRFCLKLNIGYPDLKSQIKILSDTMIEHPINIIKSVTDLNEINSMKKAVKNIHVSDKILEYVAKLLEGTRVHPSIHLGGSPRAGISIISLARSKAYINGRDFVQPDDIQNLFLPSLIHRIIMKNSIITGNDTAESVLTEILESINCIN